MRYIGYRLSIHKHTHKRYDGSPCYGPLTRVGNRACQQGARDQLRASIPGRNGERSRRCAQSQGKPRSTGQPGIQVQALRRPAAPTGLADGCRAHAGLLRAGGRGAGHLYACGQAGLMSTWLLRNAYQAGTLAAGKRAIPLAAPVVAALWGAVACGEQVRHGGILLLAALPLVAMTAGVLALSRSRAWQLNEDRPKVSHEPSHRSQAPLR